MVAISYFQSHFSFIKTFNKQYLFPQEKRIRFSNFDSEHLYE